MWYNIEHLWGIIMRVEKQKQEEIQIEKLKDIISIDYEDIYIPQSSGKYKIYPGFLVLYGASKYLFLATFDSHFEEFVRRLREVYLEEKDNIVSDGIMGPQKIKISDTTKKVLLSGELEKTSIFYEKFKNEEGYTDSLLFEEDELHSIFPIFEYHLRSILKRFDITMGDIHVSNGMNGIYYLTAMIDNKPTTFPIIFRSENLSYSMDIGNILSNSIPIHMEMSFRNNSISITNSISEYGYYDYSTYGVEKDIPYSERDIIWNGREIYYHKEHLPVLESAPDDITPKEENTKWYITPWGGYIGFYRKEDEISDQDRLAEVYYYYVHRNPDYYYELEQDSKRYYKHQPNGNHFSDIVFDSMNQKTIGVRNGNVRLFEHSFYDPQHTGFYRDHLDHKHFYTIHQDTSWKDAGNSVFINRKDGVLEKADLLDQKIFEKRLNKDGLI